MVFSFECRASICFERSFTITNNKLLTIIINIIIQDQTRRKLAHSLLHIQITAQSLKAQKQNNNAKSI